VSRQYLERVSYAHSEKVAQIAAQRLSRATEPVSLGDSLGGPIRGALGDLVRRLSDCVGGCGLRVLGTDDWKKLEPAKRKRLISLGVNRRESKGRCRKCTDEGRPGIPANRSGRRPSVRKVPEEILEKLPQIWDEVRGNGGGARELGARLGITREGARQLLIRHELPRAHTAVVRAEIFLEELEHLASFHLGVHEIATRLGLTDDELIERVEHLRTKGKTTLRFDHYRFTQEAA
jgi:hypothetical protein